MSERIGSYPGVRVEGDDRGAVSQAGTVLLVETVRKTGLDQAMPTALVPWRKPGTVHDPGKILLDVAPAVALGGDCLADVAMLRAEPGVFGPVASDPTVSRLIDTLAGAGPRALAVIRRARAEVRGHVWRLAGEAAPDASGEVVVDIDGEIRDGAWVAELAGDCLTGWPKGTRLIVGKERPHPGAQLRITDADGMRGTCFATNTKNTPIAALELRHRRRARAEGRIRNARDTGLRDLPLHQSAQSQVRLEIVQIALDLPAWMPVLALTGPARRWEPKRLRLFSAAAQLVSTGRRHILRPARRRPFTDAITRAFERLQALPNPG